MRQYELILIVQPDMEDEITKITNGIIDRAKKMITDNSGEILKTEIWGLRKLAYEINDFKEGYYVYMDVEMTPEFIAEFRNTIRYIEPILRYLITKK